MPTTTVYPDCACCGTSDPCDMTALFGPVLRCSVIAFPPVFEFLLGGGPVPVPCCLDGYTFDLTPSPIIPPAPPAVPAGGVYLGRVPLTRCLSPTIDTAVSTTPIPPPTPVELIFRLYCARLPIPAPFPAPEGSFPAGPGHYKVYILEVFCCQMYFLTGFVFRRGPLPTLLAPSPSEPPCVSAPGGFSPARRFNQSHQPGSTEAPLRLVFEATMDYSVVPLTSDFCGACPGTRMQIVVTL